LNGGAGSGTRIESSIGPFPESNVELGLRPGHHLGLWPVYPKLLHHTISQTSITHADHETQKGPEKLGEAPGLPIAIYGIFQAPLYH
jgi:hypothetical protein